MANDYFNYENPLTRHTLGRAEQVNATFFAIQEAFDKLPSPDQLSQGSVTYITDTGTANAYKVLFTRPPEAYVEGMVFTMKAATTNTGPAVINVNGLGAKQICRYDGQPLEPGDIRAGQLVILGYDGSRFLNIGAQGAEVAKARQWATSTSVVQSGEYGARGYAQQADRWANANEDVVVEGGRFSAKHWALKAMSNAGLLPDENLDIPSRSYRDLGTAAEKFRDGNFSRNVSAAAFVGSGAGLTNLNASNISSGTLPNARLSGNYSFGSLTLSGSLTADQASLGSIIYESAGRVHRYRIRANINDTNDYGWLVERWDGSTYGEILRVANSSTSIYNNLSVSGTISGNGSGITNLNASNISSGTLPAARLPNHSAALLTSGTLPSGRLSGDYSFGSLTLSGGLTANTLVSSGGAIYGTGSEVRLGPGNTTSGAISLRPQGVSSSTNQTTIASNGNMSVGGSVTASSFSGNGSGLTNLNASNLTSGTLPNARLSGNYSFGSLTLSGTLDTSGNITAPRIRLTSTTDASLSSTNHAFQIGPTDGTNLIMDGNEIMCRNNGAAQKLNINLDGGTVEIGNGGLIVAGNPVATVSTTGSASTTTFPVGHNIMVYTAGTNYSRNASETIRIADGANERYRRGGSGTALSGTWRARGYVFGTDGNAYMFQRMA